jgi:hypothetical protein
MLLCWKTISILLSIITWDEPWTRYRGYSRSNLRWTVKKTSNEKRILYIKITYILKLLLNVVTAGIEALVILENKFLYAWVKEVCRLWAQSRFETYHQLLLIFEGLWPQPVLQVDTQVVLAQSEIRAVRWVVKQLPVEMFQQCSSASSYMRVRIVMEEHSTPFVLNGPTQCTCRQLHHAGVKCTSSAGTRVY